MLDVREYIDPIGRSKFRKWFDGLNASAASKVATAVIRLRGGNFSNVKGVGVGLFEYRVDFGPGYRIYFGKDGEQLVILMGGGSKSRQRSDIAAAAASWQEYKQRKTENPNAPHS